MMTWLSAVRLGRGFRIAVCQESWQSTACTGGGFQAVSQESWQSVGRTGGVPDGQPGILAERGLNSRAEQTSKLKIWAEVVRALGGKMLNQGCEPVPSPQTDFCQVILTLGAFAKGHR